MILREIDSPGVRYSRRLTRRGYDTPVDSLTGCMILREIDSPGVQYSGRLTRRGYDTPGDLLAGVSYPGENSKNSNNSRIVTKNKNVLTHWSVAQ